MTAAAAGVSDRTAGPVLGSVFDAADTSELCPSITVSSTVVESLRGRPLLRLGDRGGLPSSLGEVGCGEGVTVLSWSGSLGGVLGGRPLFLFKGGTSEFTLDSVEAEAGSLPGGVSVFLDWVAPLPRPRCCSPS